MSTAPPGPGFTTGFQDLRTESDPTSDPIALPVRGTLPDWLRGELIRNGPAWFDVDGAPGFRHWFDGQAMLHRFIIADGAVGYRNRFLDTPGLRAARDGAIGFTEFASDPCRGLFARLSSVFRKPVPSGNTCVNVVPTATGPAALTETPIAVHFDPETLATVGVRGYTGEIAGQVTTAHPHLLPGTGEAVNYVLRFGRASEYLVYRERLGAGERELIAAVPARNPGYLHSFAVTERHVVLVVFPFVVNPLRLLLRTRPFIENYRWRPELGTRFVVVGIEDGSVREIHHPEPFFAFHHVNAFEEDGEIVLDMAVYPDAGVVSAFLLDRLRGGEPVPVPYPVRYRVHPDTGAVTRRELATESIELPRIDYRRNGKPYRHLYGVGAEGGSGADFFNQLTKVDVLTGRCAVWREPGCYPGEPVFVAAPGGEDEDDGVVLSVVLDSTTARSALLVLDARTWTELARAEVPHGIPFGFHGRFTSR